jgi:3-oxoacyl-[acyl-carrier protein] reductase
MKGSIRLDGRVALITGAAKGIGAGVAIGFAQRGAQVVLTGRQPDEEPPASLEQARQYHSSAIYRRLDVTDFDRACEVAQEVAELFGRLDVLVNNAGIYPRTSFLDLDPAEWHEVINVNLHGCFNCAKAVVPYMVEQQYGKIINVGSIQFMLGSPDLTHYIATKGGLIGFTRSLARDLGKYGIRVNCIMPGAILTEGELRDFHDQEAVARMLDEKQCLRGRIRPADIEPTFAFLASGESDPITGQSINVDHGWVYW